MKQKLVTILMIIGVLGFISACQKDNQPIQISRESISDKDIKLSILRNKLTISNSPQRSKSEVLSYVRNLLEGKGLRSLRDTDLSLEYVLNSDEGFRSLQTDKYPLADTTLFIVNIGDNKGFVLIAGDKRIPKLIAITDNGTLHKNDISNAGLKFYIDYLPTYYYNTIRKFNTELEELKSSIDKDDLRSLNSNSTIFYNQWNSNSQVVYSEWDEIKRTKPLVKVNWGQKSPYNDKAPEIGDQRCLAGCVATALAQLLATHKTVTQIANLSIDWNLLTRQTSILSSVYYSPPDDETKKAQEMVADLFLELGYKLRNRWGLEGTESETERIVPILREMGYRYVSEHKEYDRGFVLSAIEDYKIPVILSGRPAENQSGHCWLADGSLTQERTVSLLNYGMVVHSRKEQRKLLHMNWGYDGGGNGYFSDLFIHTSEPVVADDPKSHIEAKSYQQELKYIVAVPK